jgi:uncharacterized protein (TIGR03382 family)
MLFLMLLQCAMAGEQVMPWSERWELRSGGIFTDDGETYTTYAKRFDLLTGETSPAPEQKEDMSRGICGNSRRTSGPPPARTIASRAGLPGPDLIDVTHFELGPGGLGLHSVGHLFRLDPAQSTVLHLPASGMRDADAPGPDWQLTGGVLRQRSTGWRPRALVDTKTRMLASEAETVVMHLDRDLVVFEDGALHRWVLPAEPTAADLDGGDLVLMMSEFEGSTTLIRRRAGQDQLERVGTWEGADVLELQAEGGRVAWKTSDPALHLLEANAGEPRTWNLRDAGGTLQLHPEGAVLAHRKQRRLFPAEGKQRQLAEGPAPERTRASHSSGGQELRVTREAALLLSDQSKKQVAVFDLGQTGRGPTVLDGTLLWADETRLLLHQAASMVGVRLGGSVPHEAWRCPWPGKRVRYAEQRGDRVLVNDQEGDWSLDPETCAARRLDQPPGDRWSAILTDGRLLLGDTKNPQTMRVLADDLRRGGRLRWDEDQLVFQSKRDVRAWAIGSWRETDPPRRFGAGPWDKDPEGDPPWVDTERGAALIGLLDRGGWYASYEDGSLIGEDPAGDLLILEPSGAWRLAFSRDEVVHDVATHPLEIVSVQRPGCSTAPVPGPGQWSFAMAAALLLVRRRRETVPHED